MVIDNWYHCGPLASNNKLSCCPAGGYWSKWSAWQKETDKIQWTRTRTCTSKDFFCPCTGETTNIVYTCPCTAVTVINSTSTCSSSTSKTPFSIRTPLNQASQCLSTFIIEATNFRYNFYTASGSDFVTTIGWVDSTGVCQTADVPGLGGMGTAGLFYKINFPCDLTTGTFGGSLRGVAMNDLT
ncbi:Extracellular protein [Caenorhabditis elegans]|uniref:Extracellular protein n=1 Tax=Caenorhabditis elegans TaxID=6239 RepID=Q9U1U8_CAEEL|nr:Extracellular protein [Caenorhabditis elegans]CAB60452.3 Extracellular protein [Caenorhabditis elegans]|eukprot:NP_502741.3 Uncharacterized protein CELE_Y67A10A.2 [Caenorhabditis elegans]